MTPKELARSNTKSLAQIVVTLTKEHGLSPVSDPLISLNRMIAQKVQVGAPTILHNPVHYRVFKALSAAGERSANSVIQSQGKTRQHYLSVAKVYGEALDWVTKVTNPELYAQIGEVPTSLAGWLNSEAGAKALSNFERFLPGAADLSA